MRLRSPGSARSSAIVEEASQRLRTQPAELASAVDRLLASQRTLEEQLRTLRSDELRKDADALAGLPWVRREACMAGRVVGRRDGLDANELRDLAIAVRDHAGVEAVGLVGVTGPERVALRRRDEERFRDRRHAAAVQAAGAVGGGGGGTPELATAGGRNVAGVEEALVKLGEALSRAVRAQGRRPGFGLTDGANGEPRTMAEAAGARVVGIDLGERRIGVSVSDSQRVLATPHSVIARSGDLGADHRAIAAVVSEFGAGLVVVGLPLSLAGDRGPAASAAAAEAAVLGSKLGFLSSCTTNA